MPLVPAEDLDLDATTRLTIVNTTTRNFDDSSRRSIRSHAAAFGRRHQRNAPEKRVAKHAIRVLAEKGRPLSPSIQLGRGLDPFLSLPQSIVELNNGGVLDRVKSHMFQVFRQSFAHRVILPQAIQHPTFFTSMLLLAYSHYDAMTSARPSPDAIRIKIENIRQINEALQSPETAATPENICAITCLSGATTAYEMDALWDYKVHRNAVGMLVNIAGGPRVLKRSELGWALLKMLVLRDQVETATWSAPWRDFPESVLEPPPPFVATLRRSSKVWKSPIYEPPIEGLSESTWSTSLNVSTRLVLLNVRALIRLHEEEMHHGLANRSQFEQKRVGIRKAIRMAPPITQSHNGKLDAQDYIYECCRLTAMIMIGAEAGSCSFRAAVENTTMVTDLAYAIRHTDVPNMWNEHIGLFFWVTFIANTVAYHTPSHLFTTSILTNLMFEACYSDYDLSVALKPVQKITWFEEHCRSGQSKLPLR